MVQSPGRAPTFSIFDVLVGMTRRKVFILSWLLLGVLAGAAILAVFKPTYVAEARILIDDLNTPYDSANVANQQVSRESKIDERMIASQLSVIQSDDLSRRVVEALNLGGLEDFDPMRRGLGMVSQILIGLGFKDDPRNMTVEDRALKELQDSLTVFSMEKSNVIGVKYEGSSGKISADIANAIAQTYVLSTREVTSGTNTRARDWLASQIDGLRSKVSASDAAVEKFRSEKGLFKSRDITLNNQEIGELNSQITLAEAARTEAEARAQEIRDLLATQGSVDASTDVLASPTIQRLRELQVSAGRRVSELSATYLPNHPKMVAAQRDVANIEKQIRREALKVVESLQGQAKIAAKRAESLRESLDELKGRETVSLQDEVRLKELEREAKANRDQLEVMLARFADSNTRQNLELQPGFARVVQVASPPANPAFPKLGPTILLTTMSGLLLGLGLAFLMEVMAQAARANEAAFEAQFERPQQRYSHVANGYGDVDQHIPNLDMPPVAPQPPPMAPAAPTPRPQSSSAAPTMIMSLASLPAARTAVEARNLLGAFARSGGPAESFENLATRLRDLAQKGQLKALAVAGVGAGLEVSASSLALGRALARTGLKTILIDLDGTRALIPDLMELPFAPGMAELVAGQADFAAAIQRDPESPLQIIRHGTGSAGTEARLAQRMESVTHTLSGIYDLVLVHAGEAGPATLSAVKGCGGGLLFTPMARQRDAAAAAATLKASGIQNVFLVRVEGPLQQAA